MNGKARSTSFGIDREVGATPLINSKNHRPAYSQLTQAEARALDSIAEFGMTYVDQYADPAIPALLESARAKLRVLINGDPA